MVESLNDSLDNGANPYHLHQSDNPGMILVSQLLSNDNFHSWKRSMMLALSTKNKLGFVDGSIQAPDHSMVNQFNAWTRANNLINSWLLNSVSTDIAASLLYHMTGVEMWKDLVDRFQQSNGPFVSSVIVEECNACLLNNIKNNHCNLLGHTKDRCYKLIGYPPGYNSKNWSSSNSSRGKSSQVIHNNFVVSQQGSPAVTEAFTLEQYFQFNLHSVSALLIFSDLSVLFCKTDCLIQDLHQVIGKGELVQGLYLLQMSVLIQIQYLMSDNAPELKFTELFANLAIMHQFSCVETPQQNSVVERKHQHLLDVARALYFQSKMPIKFWGDCLLTATYLINRLPSPALNNKSPYEVLHGHLPDYSRLRVFGCHCFVSTLKSQQDKFSARALPAVFLGYPLVPLEPADSNDGSSLGSNDSTGDTALGSTDSNGGASLGPTDSNNNASPEYAESHADVSLTYSLD
ncbi:hypothetical protein F3Y22_tig00111213pilonHSYRG00052 [Hibiscus syriacus]|uniref:Integrase catalytic domain-containing protein n=1 Tax=Hibiscus syriacus TaxID=106335 RepID=A0A6A2YUW7_HIBSY|nr:hypothetical protein F3Y22_tig00111213pilonHSYRG00052 [Hibiscus syriacus]